MVSVNQVKQFYLITGVAGNGSNPNDGDIKFSDGKFWSYAGDTSNWVEDKTVGLVAVVSPVDSSLVPKDRAMLIYQGKGGIIKSDYVEADKVINMNVKPAMKDFKYLKAATLTLDSNINGGAPVAGEDYIVDILVSNYIALGENNTLLKFGAVRATTGMTAPELYVKLAKSFARNFSRDINKFFKICVATDPEDKSTYEEVTTTSTHDYANNSYAGVVILELPQTADYVRGEFQVTTVNFQVAPHTVIVNGDEVYPFADVDEGGTVELWLQDGTDDLPKSYLTNAYEVADTEFFCAGERGDQYRQVGYPKTIRTKYLIDVDNLPAAGYDTCDLAFYFQGRGISSQHSDKHILCAVEGDPTATISTHFLNPIMDAFTGAVASALHIHL